MPPNIFKFANWNASPLESPPRNLQKDWKLWSCGRKKHYEYDQVNSFTWPSIILISPFTIYNSKYWSLTALISEVLFYMWYLRCLFWFCFDYNPKIQDMLWVQFLWFRSALVSGYPWLGMFDEKVHRVSLASYSSKGLGSYLPKVDRWDDF